MATNPAVLTAVVGMTGVILGTFLGPYLNHRLNLKYNRRDLIFKKKLEYFERVTSSIEENTKLYRKAVGTVIKSKDPKIDKIIENLKSGRKRFLVMSSPLYFDVKNMSKKITDFVSVENKIFLEFEDLEKGKRNKSIVLESLDYKIKRLISIGNDIINEMRKELAK